MGYEAHAAARHWQRHLPLLVATLTCDTTEGRIVSTAVESRVYRTPIQVKVYVPSCYASRRETLPVIYLLHGAHADETQWLDLHVQAAADALIASGQPPFLVVMPGGAYSVDVNYMAFILDDLIPHTERQFRVRPGRSGRAIGGLSLGGYWALRIAFRHPQQFTAVGGHSPVVGLQQPNGPYALAHTANALDQLCIALDVGDADRLRHGTTRLADVLRERGLNVLLHIHSGAHTRAYWRSHTADYLRFYLGVLSRSADRHACPKP